MVKNPAFRAQIFVNPIPWGAVKSRFVLSFFAFAQVPHRILVKSFIPKIPFQTLFDS